jgi:glycosyltransferase involved in cell wall biosynthesis
MKKVVIVQKTLVQYRIEFFEGLRAALQREGVALTLIYGKMTNEDGLKKDEVDLPWSKFVANQTIKLGPLQLLWQPCLNELRGQDLIIVESANKLLLNYWLMFSRHFSRFKLAFWGHGRNLQDNPHSLANRFKTYFVKRCDWWFAYTAGVKQYLIDIAYPSGQITAVQNAIDTRALREAYAQLSAAETEALRAELGINSEQVGIYCGGMYPEKRIDFLLECSQRIKAQVPDFHLIFIGSGVDAPLVAAAAAQYDWIHYLGPKFGRDRVKYFKISALFLMPGLVGLGILDAFALETPIVTTTYPFHSPEIEYLENDQNGLMVDNTVEAYADAVSGLLRSGAYRNMLEHCRQSSTRYSIEQMIDNYKNGILQALS